MIEGIEVLSGVLGQIHGQRSEYDMIRSMTGFGRGESSGDFGRFIVEVKSVNHRFSEVVIRMPRGLSPLEERVRKAVQGSVSRGRVDVFVSREGGEAQRRSLKVDKDLAVAYYNALKELQETLSLAGDTTLDVISRLPDVFTLEQVEEEAESLWPALSQALDEALASLVGMREREGQALKQDLVHRIGRIGQLVKDVEVRAPLVVADYRERLTRRLEEILPAGILDAGRLAMEVALFGERSDITEELKRLGSHLTQLDTTLEAGDAVGRKFDFLLQEVNREVNTIGSKANDLTVTGAVVEMKSELEKIREQVQNIE